MNNSYEETYDFDALVECPHCSKPGRSMWINDIPLRAFCWGVKDDEHEEHSQVVPLRGEDVV